MEEKKGNDICSSCGYKFESDERFCPFCGMRRGIENTYKRNYDEPQATLYGPPEVFRKMRKWE